MKKLLWVLLIIFLFHQLTAQTPNFNEITIDSEITKVQPMTGIVFWQGQNTNTDAISLEFSYMLYNDVVKDSGVYNWTLVEEKLNDISSRNHQAIFRFRDTYVGKKTSIPDYIKNRSDYHETEGISEGQTTWFPDWTNLELQRFILEFNTRFAEKYDNDPRLAFLQVGFGLWAEYHIYDGPFVLGKTFPSKEFQETFLTHLSTVWLSTPWSISIDAADDTYSPFVKTQALKNLKFGNFDDSFMSSDHSGYNETCWNFFGKERYKSSPAGGEFNYYTTYDQQHVLDYPNGAHGKSYESEAKKFQISYMIGNGQPNYQTMERIKEASFATGYKFKIVSVKTATDSTVLVVTNIGTASFYYDAYPTVNGVRSVESLKNMAPGDSIEFHITAGGETVNLTIESDRLLAGQSIDFYGTSSISSIKKKIDNPNWELFPTLIYEGMEITIRNENMKNEKVLLRVYNSDGQLIISQNIDSELFSFKTGGLTQGLYIIQLIDTSNRTSIARILIQ